MAEADLTESLAGQVREAAAAGTPLAPEGGASKSFLGRQVQAETLAVSGHRGIVSYQPTELVVTARSGTPIAELEQALAEKGQMLPFEPPHYGETATLGGTIACGLSGPRRPYAGAARDLVLGTRIVNGRGEVLRFGGEVMKNVAGYDLSRLMAGAMGTLGLLLDVSMKVLPRPTASVTRVFEQAPAEAVRQLNAWAGTPLPVSGACHLDGRTFLRLEGSEGGVASAAASVGGEPLDDPGSFWRDLREQRLAAFQGEGVLWRIAVPSTTPPLALPGNAVIDWGGGLRWVRSEADADAVRSVASAAGGHATAFRDGDGGGEVFHPLAPAILRLHQRLKKAFDPQGIFNPGKLYPEI